MHIHKDTCIKYSKYILLRRISNGIKAVSSKRMLGKLEKKKHVKE